jgi:hypothetical protein
VLLKEGLPRNIIIEPVLDCFNVDLFKCFGHYFWGVRATPFLVFPPNIVFHFLVLRVGLLESIPLLGKEGNTRLDLFWVLFADRFVIDSIVLLFSFFFCFFFLRENGTQAESTTRLRRKLNEQIRRLPQPYLIVVLLAFNRLVELDVECLLRVQNHLWLIFKPPNVVVFVDVFVSVDHALEVTVTSRQYVHLQFERA